MWKSEPDAEVAAVVTGAVQRVRFSERAAALGLTAAQVATLLAPAPLPARSLEAADADQEARETIAFVSFIVLLMMILVYGSAVAEGVAQEKGTRVMELLVCRVRPRDLLAGKVLGIGLVGLGQMLLALIAGAVAIVALDTVDVPAAVPATLASAVLWFALGYAFWSVAFAAVGALVSRVEDLQAAVSPLTWTMLLFAFVAPVASEFPDAWYIRARLLLPDHRAVRDAGPHRRQRRRGLGDRARGRRSCSPPPTGSSGSAAPSTPARCCAPARGRASATSGTPRARRRRSYAVETSTRPRSPIACSRSLNFCTLPVTVIGNSSTQLHVARDLVVVDPAAAERGDRLRVGRGAAARHDPRHQLLAVARVRDAHDLDVRPRPGGPSGTPRSRAGRGSRRRG